MYTASLNTVLTENRVGAKAFHLSLMKRAGFPIPDGFVIGNNAFEEFFKKEVPLNEILKSEISSALQEVGSEDYMVRSSAIGEDGVDASFAGQLDSFICTSQLDDIVDKLSKCWASYEKDNIKVYETKSGRKLKGMAVIIQKLIAPDYAGVLFTRHPEDEDEMLVEYVEGHGEKLVSGQVSPTSCVYSRQKKIFSHNFPFDFEEGIKKANELESYYGFPLDIEWVIKDKCFYVVQARPITTLAKSKKVFWSNTNVNENYPQAITPLLYSIARDSYYHYFKNLSKLFLIPDKKIRELESSYTNVIGIFGCKMYYNMTGIHEIISASPFSDTLHKSFDNFVGYSDTQPIKGNTKGGKKISFLWEVVKFNFSLNRTVSDFETFALAYQEKVNTAVSFTELRDCFHAFIEIRMHSWYKASLADFFAMLYHGILGKYCRHFYGEDEAGGIHNRLIQAIPNLVSSIPIILIYKIKFLLRSDHVIYQQFKNTTPVEFWEWIRETQSCNNIRDQIESYLTNWGFRCSGELMLTEKNYSEEPAKFIELLQQYDNLPDSDPEKLIATKFVERKQVIADFKRHILSKNKILFPLAIVQILTLNVLIRLASKGIAARERVRLKQALLYFKFKQIIEKAGSEFKKRNLIEQEDDILFLRYQEIAEIFTSSEMLAGNRKERIRLSKQEFINNQILTYPDDFMSHLGDYPLPEAVSTHSSETSMDLTTIKGMSVCGGRIKGYAKVLTSVLEASKLELGDILVTRQTDPGWVVVFPLISGLIVERGGMLSHGAIVSREFGIPAIVGVENACVKIKDGDHLFLNADTGEITIL